MTTTAHTPGPWNVDQLDDDLIYDANGKHIATVGNAVQLDEGYETAAEVTANACLIAAAPELFAELVKVNEIVERKADQDEATGEEIAQILANRAVIAKAKGGWK